jgi:hypothetical protein
MVSSCSYNEILVTNLEILVTDLCEGPHSENRGFPLQVSRPTVGVTELIGCVRYLERVWVGLCLRCDGEGCEHCEPSQRARS